GDAIVTLPQATSLTFLSARSNPLRDEIFVPGLLTTQREIEAAQRIEKSRAPLILITNWPTPEYHDAVFGVDYGRELMSWIEAHYRHVATFTSSEHEDLYDGLEFAIRAYALNP